ncbi:MAG: hypothetical protein WAO76_09280 [Georgfuchsia sp.]
MLKKLIWIAAALAATQAFAGTIGAIAAKQGELDAAELDAKIAKAKADATGPTATLQSKVMTSEKGDPSDAIVLNGIIGIGDDLRASVSINHVGVVMKKGDAVLGWKAEAVSDYEVTLIKDGKRGGRKMTLRMVGAAPKPELPAIISGLPQLVPPIATQSR